jgi:hypothetical protein
MQAKSISVDQTLHGYDDGHRLLKSSSSLPSEVDRQLLVMSDMSGDSMISGFEAMSPAIPFQQ